MLTLSIAMLIGVQTCAQAQGTTRIFRVLGKCQKGQGPADAQFIGNTKKGRTELISFGPQAYAGFDLEGIENTPFRNLKTMFIEWQPPAYDKGTFFLRVKTTDGKTQMFTVGSTNNQTLPNLPFESQSGDRPTLNIQPASLIGANSKIKATDTISKISFLFTGNKYGPRMELFVDYFGYNGFPVPILIEDQLGNCSTLF
ncbi:MAG: hypothetical protein JST89_00100 [Cyanobacteria bacterium SZAS-4]|nr:hypothetical protein [Cyanobacteria bacterium SZAS-4]